jgi:hypothetical protein
MELLTLSLPEASFLYLGLAIQTLLRTSALGRSVGRIVLVWLFVLLWRAVGRDWTAYKPLLGFTIATLLLCALFWPEILPFGQVVTRPLDAHQVGAYAAQQDPQAIVTTAADTGQVPDTLQGQALIPPGTRMLLKAITDTPLVLARAINSQTHRPFASLMPIQWLLGVDLTADVTSAVGDWVHNCYLPVLTGTMEGSQGRTMEDLLPWDGSLLRQGLATRTVLPGAQTGITWITGPTSDNSIRCDVYLDAVEFRAQTWLFELRSPNGTPLLEVFQQELGLDPIQQARFVVYREMLRAAGPAVPAPSLLAAYGTLRGAGVAGKALSGSGGSAIGGWLSGSFSLLKTLFGGIQGTMQGLEGEWQRAIDSLSWLVGLAVFLTWWSPYILGIMNTVLLGLFPLFFLLLCLTPGQQLAPLQAYFSALLFVNFAPLWWSLIDVIGRLVSAGVTQTNPTVLGMGSSLTGMAWGAMITTLGVLLLPLVSGILIFGVFRSVTGAWRGAA